MLVPFLELKVPLDVISLAALFILIMCSSHVSSPPAGAMACLGGEETWEEHMIKINK